DMYPIESEQFIKKVLAMDWERLIPGHPGQPNGRLGTKKDAEDQLGLLQDASAEMKKLGQDGKCWDTAEKEFKLPKYANWPGYENGLPFIARRYCGLWGRGLVRRAGSKGGSPPAALRLRPYLPAACTEAAVWPNRMARSSAVRMPPMLGLTSFAFS